MLTVNQARLIDTFIALVTIDSESGDERNIANLLYDQLQSLGLEVIEDHSQAHTNLGAGNIIATLKGHPQVRPIHFTAHMDTVKPGKAIQPRMDEGIIRSEGETILGADDKVGIAAIIEVIQLLKEQAILHGDIQFIFTAGEEVGLLGAKALDRHQLIAGFGYVLDGEGPVGHIIHQSPSEHHLEIITTLPNNTPMSTLAIAKQVLKSLNLGKDSEKNISFQQYRVEASEEKTTVMFDVSVKARSQFIVKKLIQQLHERLTKTVSKLGAKLTIHDRMLYPEIISNEQAEHVQLAKAAAQQLGIHSHCLTATSGNDANIIHNLGIPTVTLTVGFDKIHTTAEYIRTADMVTLVQWLLHIIMLHTKNERKDML